MELYGAVTFLSVEGPHCSVAEKVCLLPPHGASILKSVSRDPERKTPYFFALRCQTTRLVSGVRPS